MVKCEIELKLPSLNEYINACRKNRYAGASMKTKIENDFTGSKGINGEI